MPQNADDRAGGQTRGKPPAPAPKLPTSASAPVTHQSRPKWMPPPPATGGMAPPAHVHTSRDDPNVTAAVRRAVAAQPKSAQAAYARHLPADAGNPNNLISPSDFDTYRKARAAGMVQFPLAAAAKDAVAMTVGLGPALVTTGIDAYHHPIGTAKALGKGTYAQYRDIVEHPQRSFEEHPLFTAAALLGPLAGGSRVAGTAHELQEAGTALQVAREGGHLSEEEQLKLYRQLPKGHAHDIIESGQGRDYRTSSKAWTYAKAAARQPRPIERRLTVTGPDGKAQHVYPRTSRNYGASVLQNFFDRKTEAALARLHDGQDLPPWQRRGYLNPESKVARTIADTENVQKRILAAPAGHLARYEQSGTAGLIFRLTSLPGVQHLFGGGIDVGHLLPKGEGLSAAQQKAVQILVSGEDAAAHGKYHGFAMLHTSKLDAGKEFLRVDKMRDQDLASKLVRRSHAAHEAQQQLTKMAAEHLDDPLVHRAAEHVRQAIAAREKILGYRDADGNLTEKGALSLGKHTHELQHGAAGFTEGSSLLDELHTIEEGHGPVPMEGAGRQLLDREIAKTTRLLGRAKKPQTIARHQERLHELSQHAGDPEFLRAEIGQLDNKIAALGRPVLKQGRPNWEKYPKDLRAPYAGMQRIRSAMQEQLLRAEAHTRHGQIRSQLVQIGRESEKRGAHYLPSELNTKTLRTGGTSRINVRSAFGAARKTQRTQHPFTGMSMRSGDTRINAPGMARRAFMQAQRVEDFNRVHDVLWHLASKERYSDDLVPIRSEATIPPELRRVQQHEHVGHLTDQDMSKLTESKVQALKSHLFPHQIEEWENGSPDVRWLDPKNVRRLMPSHDWGGLGRALSPIDYLNQVVRFGRFLGLGYGLWLPQNLVLHLAQAGPYAVRNLGKVMGELDKVKPETYDKLAEAIGTGVSQSFVGDAKVGQKAMQAIAGKWAHIVDHYPRMMSLVHEMQREGFRTAKDWDRLANAPEGSLLHAKFLNIARRAGHEAIDYNSMTPLERATLKKLFTSWAWVRGATAYGLKFPIEHPGLSTGLAQVARQHEGDEDRYFGGHMPSWLDGYQPLGKHHGLATMLDTKSTNALAQVGDDVLAVEGLVQPRSSNAYDLRTNLSPVVGALISAVSGTNAQGVPYAQKGAKGNISGAVADLAKRFQPWGDYKLATKKGGVEKGGPQAAIFRLGGVPLMRVDYQQAAAAGKKDYRSSLAPGKRYGFDLQTQTTEAKRLMPKAQAFLRKNVAGITDGQLNQFEAHVFSALRRQASLKEAEYREANRGGASVKKLSGHDHYRITSKWARQYMPPAQWRMVEDAGRQITGMKKLTPQQRDAAFQKVAQAVQHGVYGQYLSGWKKILTQIAPAPVKKDVVK